MTGQQMRIFAEMLATQARIMGMQAENQIWVARGSEPCYGEKDFDHMACQLGALGQEAMGLRHEQ